MGHKVGIMQPYFLPYMGYWQLIAEVDQFVLYDNIEYTKKGWINRNRFLLNGKDEIFSLPLKKTSDFLPVSQKELADNFDRMKLIRQLQGAYRKAPFFEESFPLIEEIIACGESNLFAYIKNSIVRICSYLSIETDIIVSSDIADDHEKLKGEAKVIAICEALAADHYINPIGGLELYSRVTFAGHGMALSFLRSQALDYDQFGRKAIPHLSILDVLMFNGKAGTKNYLSNFTLE